VVEYDSQLGLVEIAMGKLELGFLVGSGKLEFPALRMIEAKSESSYTLPFGIVCELAATEAISYILINVLLADSAVTDIFALLPALEM
jgi:hypothetical protein